MNERELIVLSFGAGQDSTTLLYKWIYDPGFRLSYPCNRFLVVMADTGDEHDQTYAHIQEVSSFCEEHRVEFVFITPDMGYHGSGWQSLIGFYRTFDTIGSKAFPKTCTDRLKIGPIYDFLERWLVVNYRVRFGRKKAFIQFAKLYGRIGMMVGIAAGEEQRLADMSQMPTYRQRSVDMLYPLVDLGWDRATCQEYIRSVGHTVPLPSNCKRCPFMSLIELLWLYRFYPADYHEWVELEANKIAKNRHMRERNYGVWGKKLLPEMLEVAKKKHGHMTDAQLWDYKMSHGHCVMSKY